MIRFLKKKIKNSILLISIILLMCSMVASASALPLEPDPSIKGSISTVLKDSKTKEPITDGAVTLYKVADAVKSGADWSFELTRDFINSGAKIADLPDADLAKTLAEYAAKYDITGETEAVDYTGKVSFTDLSIGLYLMVHSTPSTGYNPFSSFFVTVPLYQAGAYVYEVDASPKMEITDPSDPPPGGSPDPSPTPTPLDPPPPGGTPDPTPTPTPTVPPPPPATQPPSSGVGGPDGSPGGGIPGYPNGTPDPNGGSSGDPGTGIGTGIGTNTRLPQTGQLNWPVPVLAGMGLLLFAFGWYLFASEEKRVDE